jgi:putative CocE/NonD family hydrolase
LGRAPEEDATLQYIFDPANPVPTHGGANLFLPSGAFEQRHVREGRDDILAFATEPLTEPLEITGRVRVKLFVSSDAPDTDFTAKLVDIFPAGDDREILMLDGVQRVKARNSLSEAAPLLTGADDIVELEIDLWSIAWVLNKGHRIGLHVSSSNYPRFEVNPNTGADQPVEEMRKALNQVHLGGVYPSRLILPVRPE